MDKSLFPRHDNLGIATKRAAANISRRHYRRARACRCVRSLKRPQYQIAERPAALGGKFNFSWQHPVPLHTALSILQNRMRDDSSSLLQARQLFSMIARFPRTRSTDRSLYASGFLRRYLLPWIRNVTESVANIFTTNMARKLLDRD